MKRIVFTVLFLVLTCTVQAADPLPDQIARNVTDKIIELLKTNKNAYAKDHQKLYAMADEQVLPHFDFRAMSRTVLGRYWRSASEDQRTRFTSEFRNLLVRTYATALLKYNDEQIAYLPFKLGQGDRIATVRSKVNRTDGGPPINIIYSFYLSNDGWKVYDVTIEGASLVTTYQATYAEEVQNKGLDALIVSLAQGNKQESSGKAAADGATKGGPAK